MTFIIFHFHCLHLTIIRFSFYLIIRFIFLRSFACLSRVSELLMLTNHQLCRKIVNLSLRVNELNNAIQLSKEHVSNVRAEKMKTVRLEKQNTQKRLNEQKKHYEDIVQRHQTFIEQLLKDKANLCEKMNQASRRLDSQNQAWEHKLKTEIERAKETVMAGEKLRRERWVRDNTKKIKELTGKFQFILVKNSSTVLHIKIYQSLFDVLSFFFVVVITHSNSQRIGNGNQQNANAASKGNCRHKKDTSKGIDRHLRRTKTTF